MSNDSKKVFYRYISVHKFPKDKKIHGESVYTQHKDEFVDLPLEMSFKITVRKLRVIEFVNG